MSCGIGESTAVFYEIYRQCYAHGVQVDRLQRCVGSAADLALGLVVGYGINANDAVGLGELCVEGCQRGVKGSSLLSFSGFEAKVCRLAFGERI